MLQAGIILSVFLKKVVRASESQYKDIIIIYMNILYTYRSSVIRSGGTEAGQPGVVVM